MVDIVTDPVTPGGWQFPYDIRGDPAGRHPSGHADSFSDPQVRALESATDPYATVRSAYLQRASANSGARVHGRGSGLARILTSRRQRPPNSRRPPPRQSTPCGPDDLFRTTVMNARATSPFRAGGGGSAPAHFSIPLGGGKQAPSMAPASPGRLLGVRILAGRQCLKVVRSPRSGRWPSADSGT
ncbi:hypothetical protein ACRAWD_30625 [Caulobacter segnis]